LGSGQLQWEQPFDNCEILVVRTSAVEFRRSAENLNRSKSPLQPGVLKANGELKRQPPKMIDSLPPIEIIRRRKLGLDT
jgi:hypothetical protein